VVSNCLVKRQDPGSLHNKLFDATIGLRATEWGALANQFLRTLSWVGEVPSLFCHQLADVVHELWQKG